jgi:zinc protease
MNVEQTTINHLKTLFINSPGATASTVQIWFRAGSALEKPENEGIAHFLEHMFFKGTKKRPGPQIAHEVESFGGEINAFTSFDYTCYYINTPASNLHQSVDILLDMVANPLFTESDIPSERDVVFEEYRRALDNPSQFHFMQLQKTCMEEGYFHPILGNEKTIKNFSQSQLKQFRNEFYNRENCMLVIAGDLLQKEKIEKLINSFNLPKGNESHFGKFNLKSPSQIDIHNKAIRQATLTIAIQAPSYLADITAAQDLVINCLAHGETSRLYQLLVSETSICNGISGSTMYFSKGGAHFIKMSLPYENLSKALTIFEQNLKDIATNGFSNEEIQKIKNQYLASKIYEKESIESYAFSLGHGFAQNGQIFCEDEFIAKIKKCTTAEVNQAVKAIFSKAIHLSFQIPNDLPTEPSNKIINKFQKNISSYFNNIKDKKTFLKPTQTSVFDSQVQLITLLPGVELLYRQNLMTPTFVFHSYMKGGMSFENEKSSGQYSLLARLLNYGSTKFPYKKIKNFLEDRSASLSGFSGKNATGMTMHGQTQDFKGLIEAFSECFLRPEIPQKYFNHEKKIILRVIDNQKEDPVKQCFKEFNQLIFNKHPYSLDISGTKESLKKVSPAILKRLHQKTLKNSNLMFTYVGDMSLEDLIHELKPLLSHLKPRKIKKVPAKKPAPIVGQIRHIELKREQTHIVIGTPGFKMTDKEDLYLKMFSSHLSGQSSELFVEVRDKQGLCYSVQPVHMSALEAGSWGIYIGTGNDKKEKAQAAILALLQRVSEEGLKEEEFERIKKMMEGQVQLSLQTNDDWAHFYSVPILHGYGVDFQHLSNKQIKEASYNEFQLFIKSFLKKKWNIISAGPSS